MRELWIVLLCLVIGVVSFRIGVAFVSRIASLLAVEMNEQSGLVMVDGLYLPGAALIFLVAGNAWLIFFQSGLNSSAAASVLFIALLWLLAYIDAHTTILPDVLTGMLAASGLALRLSGLRGRWDDVDAYLAMALGVGAPMLINWVYRRFRGSGEQAGEGLGADAIGQGDAKLLAGMGIWLGLHSLCMAIMFAVWLSLLYSLCKGLKNRRLPVAVPLGPFLALAGNIRILT